MDEKGVRTTPLDFVLRLAAGRYDDLPFNEALLDQARLTAAEHFGMGRELLGVSPGQCFRLDLIAQLLRAAADPDWPFFEALKEGLPLGVDTPMDRTPPVFEDKLSWKLNEVDSPATHEREK